MATPHEIAIRQLASEQCAAHGAAECEQEPCASLRIMARALHHVGTIVGPADGGPATDQVEVNTGCCSLCSTTLDPGERGILLAPMVAGVNSLGPAQIFCSRCSIFVLELLPSDKSNLPEELRAIRIRAVTETLMALRGEVATTPPPSG